MKPRPVTFDSIDISVHQRYAKDQAILDATFIKEPHFITPHTEITATTSIFSSKWEELFDIHKRSSSWALFSAPEDFFSQRNKFFSHTLLPELHLLEETKEENKELSPWREPKTRRLTKEEILKKSKLAIETKNSEEASALEKDYKTICTLLESIETISKLLLTVQARKLQFQKG